MGILQESKILSIRPGCHYNKWERKTYVFQQKSKFTSLVCNLYILISVMKRLHCTTEHVLHRIKLFAPTSNINRILFIQHLILLTYITKSCTVDTLYFGTITFKQRCFASAILWLRKTPDMWPFRYESHELIRGSWALASTYKRSPV